ncbi:MAG: glycosyltransferase [Bacteroidetes bacterium]|nr:glycosyltransferase [Bacteroidota bacterium]
MKILLVITKAEVGGAQVFVLNLAKSLKKLGCEVEVAAGEGEFLYEELRKHKIPYYYLNSLRRGFSILKSLYFIFDLYKLLRKNDYDVIHLNSSNTLIGALSAFPIKKTKAFFTFHGLSFIDNNYSSNTIVKYFAKLYFRVLLKLVDGAVCECKLNYDEVMEANIVASSPIIYNGLDEQDLTFLSTEEAKGYLSQKCGSKLDNHFVIGTTGRLAYQKNHEFLINNFKQIKERIPEARIVIIGDGPDFNKFSSLIAEKGIKEDFFLIGEIENSHQYLKGFDVFVMPSRYEGVSISLIETLYSESPILASDVGGNKEVVGNCEKQLFEFDNFKEFIEKLLEIKNNRDYFVEYNRNMKSKFSLDKMAESYKELFDSVGY